MDIIIKLNYKIQIDINYYKKVNMKYILIKFQKKEIIYYYQIMILMIISYQLKFINMLIIIKIIIVLMKL